MIRVRTAMLSPRSVMPEGHHRQHDHEDGEGQRTAERGSGRGPIPAWRGSPPAPRWRRAHRAPPKMPCGRRKRVSTKTTKTRISEPVPEQVERADGLHQADQQPADHGADDVAEPAEHDDDEREDRELLAHGRGDADQRRHQAAGDRDAGGADREGQGVDPADVDADQCRAAGGWTATARIERPNEVLRRMTVRATVTATAPRKAMIRSQESSAPSTRQRAVDHGADRLGPAAEDHQQHVDDQQRQAERDQQRTLVAARESSAC